MLTAEYVTEDAYFRILSMFMLGGCLGWAEAHTHRIALNPTTASTSYLHHLQLRDGRDPASPWRNRPIQESLREFEAMKFGKYEEGEFRVYCVTRLEMGLAPPLLRCWRCCQLSLYYHSGHSP